MTQGKPLVLIADDEEMNKIILMRRLRREGFDTLEVSDGAEAVAKIRSLAGGDMPHAVLMDIHMPVMDGIEATRILKNEFLYLPVIAVTASLLNRMDYSRYGFDELCTKPVNFPDLFTKLHRCMNQQTSITS